MNVASVPKEETGIIVHLTTWEVFIAPRGNTLTNFYMNIYVYNQNFYNIVGWLGGGVDYYTKKGIFIL